ncbi:hypothetical protein BDV06DRAFT_216569 [Aspergillus oleicola]
MPITDEADNLERLMEEDSFTKWGFAIYRCTYESNSDWETFMTRLYDSVKDDNPSPRLSLDTMSVAEAGRYRFFIMVDQVSLESVLKTPNNGRETNLTGYVGLVRDEDSVSLPRDEEGKLVPLEGSMRKYVGWINVLCDHAGALAYLDIRDNNDFNSHYERPPPIQWVQ